MPSLHTVRRSLLIAVFATPTIIFAQTPFTVLKGETVQGDMVELPVQDGLTWTIVAVACGKKAQPMLEEWFGPAYNRFVMKSGLFAASYKAELYLVPIFTGMDKAAYGPSMNTLRKNVDADIARRVLFFKGDADEVLGPLGIKNRNIPYFFTVDPKGNIVHRESGKFDVDKLDALEEPML